MSSRPVYAPTSIDDAIDALARYGDEAKVVAGSTAVTIMLRQRLLDPELLVMLHHVPGLRSIYVDGDDLVLEALVTHADVERNALVRRHAPVLAQAFAVIGNVRVRSVGTVGGVLAEADYASDPPCVLRALDARVVAQGPSGERTIPIEEFFQGFYETAVEPDELITAVRVPIQAEGVVGVYEKFKTRSSEDRPCVGAVASVQLAPDGTCGDLRVAVGAASEVPERHRDLEALAVGHRIDDDVAQQIASAYAERIDALEDMRGSSWYRTAMVEVWVRRAITTAARRAATQRAA